MNHTSSGKKAAMDQPSGQIKDDADVARCILNYLQKHPQACDTLEGITNWWILQQRLSESIDVIQRSLEVLRADGLIIEQRRGDGQITYSLFLDEDE
jgi:hypothetical protein